MSITQGITPKQLAMLHALLNETGQLERKQTLIYNATNGRTTSSRELTYSEVKRLIDYLKGFIKGDDRDRLSGKVLALAYQAGFIYGETPEDKKMNLVVVNKFLERRGAVRKHLNEMTREELLKTIKQFSAWAKRAEQSKHNKEVMGLLDELNLSVKGRHGDSN